MSGHVLPPAVKSIGLSRAKNRKPQSLLEAAQHNRRHPDGGGWRHKSDPAKIYLNKTLCGPETAEGVVLLQEKMMLGVSYKPKRKDYAQAFEVIFTTPAGFSIDYGSYFEWCLAWTRDNLGSDSVLSADIHIDESTPHLHILMAPIVDSQWVGSKFTSIKTWPKLQVKFGVALEKKFGLKLMTQLKGDAKVKAAIDVKKELTRLLAPHISSDLLEVILKQAERDPAGFTRPLGIVKGNNGDGDDGREFRRIALSTGKGSKHEKEQTRPVQNLITSGVEIQHRSDVMTTNTILVSGFELSTSTSSPTDDTTICSSDACAQRRICNSESTTPGYCNRTIYDLDSSKNGAAFL